MRGHTIIQAISRVNRVFRDKPHGLIVDYIGIGDELREATNRTRAGGGRGNPAPEHRRRGPARLPGRPAKTSASSCRPGTTTATGGRCSGIALEDLLRPGLRPPGRGRGCAATTSSQAELRLTAAFLLVKHLDDCRPPPTR